MIYASRNIMNSMKNVKGLRHDIEEFDSSDNKHLNLQYRLFRRRLIGLYHSINSFFDTMEDHQEQYRILLRAVVHIEQQDAQLLSTVMKLAAAKDIDEREISSLLMANRLFSQSCRLQVFSLKDLLLGKKEIMDFDHAMDMKELLDEEHGRRVKDDEVSLENCQGGG
jgi:phosphate:Na+ symporter